MTKFRLISAVLLGIMIGAIIGAGFRPQPVVWTTDEGLVVRLTDNKTYTLTPLDLYQLRNKVHFEQINSFEEQRKFPYTSLPQFTPDDLMYQRLKYWATDNNPFESKDEYCHSAITRPWLIDGKEDITQKNRCKRILENYAKDSPVLDLTYTKNYKLFLKD